MKYEIKPSRLSGTVYVPPSKSHTLRALVFGLLGSGPSVIRNFLPSNDTMLMIEAIKQFGAKVKIVEDVIEVIGVDGRLSRPKDVIDCGNSGIIYRFMAALAALSDGYTILTGDESIRERRPILPLLEVLSSQNLFAKSAPGNGKGPIIIQGRLHPGVMGMDGGDSQPVSAMLIALSFLSGPSELYVTRPGEQPWVDMTMGWFSHLEIKVKNEGYRHYHIAGSASYDGFDVTIPGDFSTATYPIAGALIGKGEICVHGLEMRDTQADKRFLEIIKQLGASVDFDDHTGALYVSANDCLEGGEIDVNDCIDTLPLLAVLGCYAKSQLTLTGAKIARTKECDRIKSIALELKKMGAEIKENDDGLVISPKELTGANLSAHRDHRIAMSLVVAALGAKEECVIDGVESIAKTYPTFFHDYVQLGADIV